jgi:hypothetical protein
MVMGRVGFAHHDSMHDFPVFSPKREKQITTKQENVTYSIADKHGKSNPCKPEDFFHGPEREKFDDDAQ